MYLIPIFRIFVTNFNSTLFLFYINVFFYAIRNMFPLLFALGRRVPVLGDILGAFEGMGGSNSKGSNDDSNKRKGTGNRQNQKRYQPDF